MEKKRRIRYLIALCYVLFTSLINAFADDTVGIRRYRSACGEDVEFVMPFTPLVRGCVDGFLAGAFSGDGENGSDALAHFLQDTNTVSYAVRCAETWVDAECGVPAFIDARVGDGFILTPGESSPLDFFAFGRLPWAVPTGLPWFSSMRVAHDGGAVEFEIASDGNAPVDMLATSASGAWTLLGRFAAEPAGFGWRDSGAGVALGATDERIYLLANASRDADGDGVSDHLEMFVYGTSPLCADSDGDGLSDGLELSWGYDPLVPGGGGQIFSEGFELPGVSPGAINGQNGWFVTETGLGEVVANEAHGGEGALSLGGEHEEGYISHMVASASSETWIEMWLKSGRGGFREGAENIGAVAFAVDDDGHPVASDGMRRVINEGIVIPEDHWMRVNMRLDYVHRVWDCYIDGIIAFSNLAMQGEADSLRRLTIAGGGGFLDDVFVSDQRPKGLSSDGDLLPDEWEFRHFGSLDRDGRGDADGDGAPDIVEFRAGTDPLLADTDFDGYTDGQELAWGMDPLTACASHLGFRFFEGFERPTVAPGNLDGQNGWSVAGAVSAMVQEEVRRSGEAALRVKAVEGNEAGGEISRMVDCAADEVWLDFSVQNAAGFSQGGERDASNAIFFFNESGYPVCSDGDLAFTNYTVVAGDGWTRVTIRLDYTNQTWDCYVDGVCAARSLQLRGSPERLRRVRLASRDGAIDDITVSTERPAGLSVDDDPLPDEWEISRLWTLDFDGFGDFDRDGLTDYEELMSGTDPLIADTDGDGLPDGWEVANGTNPFADDAAADPDGDGLDNLEEFYRGTNPLRADTDGDGLPDRWEVAWGTNPIQADASVDPDKDGLANLEEFRAGSDPFKSDSDGDGVDDKAEFEIGSDPAFSEALQWVEGRHICSATNEVAFEVETTGVFAVTVAIAQEWLDYGRRKRTPPVRNRIGLRLDGHVLAFRDFPVELTNVVNVTFFTPVLAAGGHGVSVVLGHPEFRLHTEVVGMTLARCQGVDLEGVALRRNAVGSPSCASLVSPAFVEGEARFPWRVSSPSVSVSASGARSWYADVPLSPDGPTVAEFTFEDAATTNVVVEWSPTDLFAAPGPIRLRKGSSILVSGLPEGREDGVVEVYTNGVRACSYEANGFAVIGFDGAATYSVVAVWHDDETRVESPALVVTSVAGGFAAERPACQVGVTRTWQCPDLPDNCTVSGDEHTAVGWSSRGVLNLRVDDTRGDRFVTARIEEGGAVLDVAQVDPFWAVAVYGNVVYSIETNAYGTLCRAVMAQCGASPSVSFRIQSYLSSVLLDDLTTSRTIGYMSFDDNGHYVYDLIKPVSVSAPCHSVYIYQGAVKIGEAVYGNGLMPEEWR